MKIGTPGREEQAMAAGTVSPAQHTLDRIEEIIAREGDIAQTQQKIGALLVDLVRNPEFRHDVDAPLNHRGTKMWTLAKHEDGELFSLIRAWQNHPYDFSDMPDSVHYHGGWEVLTMVDGNWIDSFYETITDEPFSVGVKSVKFARNEEIKPGEFMVIDPYTPHGYRTGDKRDVRGIMITYIGALRQGRRMNLDPVTGEATVAMPVH
jgi:hypothetical protein